MQGGNAALQDFIDYQNNTHNKFASASMVAFLLRLAKKYLPQGSQSSSSSSSATNNQGQSIDEYISLFQRFVANNMRPLGINTGQYESIINYLQGAAGVLHQPANEFDTVTIFIKGYEIRRAFPLKEVFALVCIATMDVEVYKEADRTKTPSELEHDRIQRIKVLCITLLELAQLQFSANRICHQGVRHDLVGTLNKVYPGAHFIDEMNSFFQDAVVSVYLEALKTLPIDAQSGLFSAWVAGDESSVLKAFFTRYNGGAKEKLCSVCKVHYINPADPEVTGKINATTDVNVLVYLPVPLEIHAKAKYFHSILTAKPDTNVARNRALMLAQSELRRLQCTFINIPRKLQHFCKVEKIYQLCQKVRYMLWGTGTEGYLQASSELCNAYFCNFLHISDDVSKKQLAVIATFRKHLGSHLANLERDHSFVTNFLLHFANFSRENNRKQMASMYMRLRAQKDTIVIPDALVASMTSSAASDGTRNIEPYQINRTLAHALLVSPADWSAQFYYLFSNVIQFIENNLNLPASDPRREGYAYYQDYLSEFKLLEVFYLRSHPVVPTDSESEPLFIFPHEPTMCMLPNLDGLQGMAVCGRYSKIVLLLQKAIAMPDNVLEEILEKCCDFLDSSCRILAIILRELPVDIFKELPADQWYNFISRLLGSFSLITIIKDVYDLAVALKELPVEKWVDFRSVLGAWHLETLKTTTKEGHVIHVVSVIEEFPYYQRADNRNQYRFLKILGADFLKKWLNLELDQPDCTFVYLIHGILSRLSPDDRYEFLKILGADFLKKWIAQAATLMIILDKLCNAEPNKQFAFVALLGADFLRLIINSSNNLDRVLKAFPSHNRMEFLGYLGKEFLHNIINNPIRRDKISLALREQDKPEFARLFN